MDPEQPTFTTGLHPAALPQGQAPVNTVSLQMPAEQQAEAVQSAHQPGANGAALATVQGTGVGQQGYLEKGGMPHSDSAVSLPSNASSVQAPGTPIAPAMVGTG